MFSGQRVSIKNIAFAAIRYRNNNNRDGRTMCVNQTTCACAMQLPAIIGKTLVENCVEFLFFPRFFCRFQKTSFAAKRVVVFLMLDLVLFDHRSVASGFAMSFTENCLFNSLVECACAAHQNFVWAASLVTN